MTRRKFFYILFTFLMVATIVSGSAGVSAMPDGPTDETKVPHYFGPNPNWANSPFTVSNAVVQIVDTRVPAIGSGATVVANVDPVTGGILTIDVTSPGHDYDPAFTTVQISGGNGDAIASAIVSTSGVVIGFTNIVAGSGYSAFQVAFSNVGETTSATAVAYGGVDAVTVVDGGLGYTVPTVEFDLPDAPDGVQATGHVASIALGDAFDGMDANGTILPDGVIVDDPGSGYSFAPGVAIHNGTLYDPIAGATLATASTTLKLLAVTLTDFGSGYLSAPDVFITDPVGGGIGADAIALTDIGAITAVDVTSSGTGYLSVGIRKFVDTLPGLGPDGANNLGQYIPVAVPDQTTFPGADYYEIGVVEYMQQMHSDLPPTKLRGYVQLETPVITGIGYPLPGGKTGVDAPRYLGPTIVAQRDRPVRITFYNLLPTGAAGDLFLPVDSTIMGSGEANMEMPYDPVPTTGGTVEDGARNPMCSDKYYMPGMRMHCFTDNRATLHLHGGNVPWISDGTPHQWITPAGEGFDAGMGFEPTMWPEGVSVESVPDMVGQAAIDAGIPDCSAPNDGCQTFYYTNQQSARLMFYHDHSWGITRLNVYAGEAAGYVITDATEQSLFGAGGPYADLGEGIPLVVQDRTFVPKDEQLYNQYDADGNVISYGQDPTWDAARWGSYGSLWYHHVYMPAQNPGDPGGMSGFGRWMYGPWFWPPNGEAKFGPIANPYYNMDPEGPDGMRGTTDDWSTTLATPCSLDIPATWQYQEDPFCEPAYIPGTPNISVGMEQFNDTPMVNGVAYPTVTLDPKTYRFRMLNAANDRFFNFQWYVASDADPTVVCDGTQPAQVPGGPARCTEVALDPALVAAAQLDPVVFPTPDLTRSPAGPDWVHFGTESGFTPKPVVVDGQQVTTWITDPTRFDVGDVDQHSLLLAPAERADVIVDFSQFAGKTLILYNDAPAAFPARIPSYDYYTGAPDLSPVGAPTILPGYGPNTRTIMQVKIAPLTPAPAFNVTGFQNRFNHKADGSGVFEKGQHPIIVGQSPYNTAYGKSFASSGYCDTPQARFKCDGYARINDQGGDPFTFDTLYMNANGSYPTGKGKLSIPLQPKAIHDEMNSTNFDEFGRMQATLGVEVVPATPGLQNVVLSPFVFPTTELFDTTALPRANVTVTPIATASDGSQIWKITHNGVDTHPIHFHGMDVQVLNRVTWDNIIKPPHPTELGWKETVRVSPLEDTIVAMRPVIPVLPFDFPNSIRLLSPMMPDGQAIDLSSVKDPAGLGMTAFAPSGDPIDVYNHYVNFGAEYVYHCHILSHEEMDMMHAVLFAFPPMAPSDLVVVNQPTSSYPFVDLAWTDNSRSETAWVVQRSSDGVTWDTVATIRVPLGPGAGSTTGDTVTYSDPVDGSNVSFSYRVQAINVVGDTWNYANGALNEIVSGGFPTVTTVSGFTNEVSASIPAPDAPASLTVSYQYNAGPELVLSWPDPNGLESGYRLERSDNGGPFVQINGDLAPDTTSFVDTAVAFEQVYSYQVYAFNASGSSLMSPIATAVMPPTPPSGLTAIFRTATNGNGGYLPPRVDLAWTATSVTETGFVVERCAGEGCTDFAVLATLGADTTSFTDNTPLLGNTAYSYRVKAVNVSAIADSPYSNTASIATPDFPAAPTNVNVVCRVQNNNNARCRLTWTDVANNTGYTVQRATNSTFTAGLTSTNLVGNGNITVWDPNTNLNRGASYFYRIRSYNANGASSWVNANPFPVITP